MSTGPETQAMFDRIMDQARRIGAGMADLIVTSDPPPWPEDWFMKVHRNVIDGSGEAVRKARPEYPEVLVANYQVRVKEGFEARIRKLMEGGLPQGGMA